MYTLNIRYSRSSISTSVPLRLYLTEASGDFALQVSFLFRTPELIAHFAQRVGLGDSLGLLLEAKRARRSRRPAPPRVPFASGVKPGR